MELSQLGASDMIQSHEKKINALVVEDVKVVTREVEVVVPKFVERIVEVPVYVNKEVEVTHVKVNTETVTTQNITVEERIVEVPKLVEKDVIVERPVYKPVEVKDVTIRKVEMPVEVPRITEKLKIVEQEYVVKVPKLVEEIIKVPQIKYIPTEVERIIWKDVPRERCAHCGKMVE